MLVDADTHLIESEEMWDLLDPSLRRQRPMDRLGVDVQVLYPTFFLQPVTQDVGLYVGLARAYNQWAANVWSQSGGRIRWVVVPPLGSPADTFDEIAWGKQHGAVGVFMHGIEELGSAADRAYFGVYAKALEHDLAICIHTGLGNTYLSREFSGFQQTAVIHAFRDLILNSVAEEFPGLRFGFLEASASWLPYVFHFLIRAEKARSRLPDVFSKDVPAPADLMRQSNLYVACESDEDIEDLLHVVAPENLVIGSDYGHVDPAFESHMTAAMRSRTDLPSDVVEAIMTTNSMALYGITENDRAEVLAASSH
jgi:uncharacterized protein